MKKQFNFQLRQQNDRRDWEEIEVYYQTLCDRTTAIRYAQRLFRTFHSEVRLTEGKEPLKTSGTYIYEQAEPLKVRNYGKLV
ncbi:addiction module toxin RelE [Chryseobacterium taklimakanense]|uniref:addiction module toxin RelE n=1 Tax=Chryseobacterium taklimakanense TaxID=536441 RepID=UPI0023F88AEF|nr:addiction module toxin RelE [Chryseobacterium taklimakanense]